jgi:hypothetical protein
VTANHAEQAEEKKANCSRNRQRTSRNQNKNKQNPRKQHETQTGVLEQNTPTLQQQQTQATTKATLTKASIYSVPAMSKEAQQEWPP